MYELRKPSEMACRRESDTVDGRDCAGKCALKAAKYRTSWQEGSARCFTTAKAAVMVLRKNVVSF